jgi:hypothetical protein
MANRWLTIVAVLVMLVVQGCAATGPKAFEMSGALNVIPPGYGRIVFFRANSVVGAAIQPDIRVDGQVVGQSRPGGFFYVDASPGRHVASSGTENTSSADVQVVAGQTHYVRSAIGMGLLVGRVTLTLEGRMTAQPELAELSYTGTAPVRLGAPGAASTAAPLPKQLAVAPALKRGDQLIYRITDKLTGLSHEVTYAVDRVDGDRVHFNQGGRIEGKDGSVVSVNVPLAGDMDRCSPPGGWARAAMSPGMGWSVDYERPPGSGCAGNMRLEARVVSEDPIPTPLGERDAQRIDFRGSLQRTERYTLFFRLEARAWYVPALGRVVRFESELVPQVGAGGPSRELVELVAVHRD